MMNGAREPAEFSTARGLDFIGVGPQRTASSWLHTVLIDHPALAFPHGVKETFFFDDRYDKGWDWYLWHFRDAPQEALRGEVATTCFHNATARQRVAETCPAARVIISVRNPSERAISLFRHHRSRGRVSSDFEEACKQIPAILAAGDYAEHAPLWEKAFGAENVHYVVMDDVAATPQQVIDQVCRFLKVAPIPLSEAAKRREYGSTAPRFPALARILSGTATALRARRLHWINELGKRMGLKRLYIGTGEQVAVSSTVRARLADRYAPHVEWLEQRLGRRFENWRVNA